MQRAEIPRSPSGFILIITVFDTANLNHKRGFHVLPEYNGELQPESNWKQCVLHITPPRRN